MGTLYQRAVRVACIYGGFAQVSRQKYIYFGCVYFLVYMCDGRLSDKPRVAGLPVPYTTMYTRKECNAMMAHLNETHKHTASLVAPFIASAIRANAPKDHNKIAMIHARYN